MRKRRGVKTDSRYNIDPLTISNDCRGPRIVDRVKQLVAAIHDICWHSYCTNPPDGKVTDQVFWRTVKVDTDTVTFFYAKVYKPETNPVHFVSEFFVGIGFVSCRADQCHFFCRNTFCIKQGGNV